MYETSQHPSAGQPSAQAGAEAPSGERGKRKLLLFGRSSAALVAAGLLVGLLSASASVAAADSSTPTAASPTSGTANEPGHKSGKGHKGPNENPLRLAPGVSLLVGTLADVQGGKLSVNRDGGGQVTVTTDSSTKVRGPGVRTLSDLKPGERVVVKVKDGKALGVLLARGHAVGTLTSVSGDQAVLEQPNGLIVDLGLSGVANKPKAGDLVSVVGKASGDGKTLEVEQLRELPRAGS